MPSAALRPAILGGVDGVITSFTIVAGASAGALSTRAVVVVGTSSLLADGVSMGVSEFLSSAAATAGRSTDGALSPARLGLVCFSSFVFFGALPLAAYLALMDSLAASAASALAALAILGVARARIADESVPKGIVQTVTLGSAAGLVAYAVGILAATYA